MTPEQKYTASTSLKHRKKYGQFFTPECIAAFMCKWVLLGKSKTKILEPAYGLGIFSRVFTQIAALPIDAYEIDSKIYSFASIELPKEVKLLNTDYFNCDWNSKYDAIVCNPPYLKFHDYDNYNYISDVNNHLETNLNGFTNLYTLFLLKSIAQLQVGGRLAYIIPSEFLNADYGVEVKRALIDSGMLKHIIVVDFTKCPFDDSLTTACIILCENTKSDAVRFSTLTDINQIDKCLDAYTEYNVSEIIASVKWKKYYEGSRIDKYKYLVPFSNFAKVTRGIATGANNYFALKKSKAVELNIPKECLMPCICKAIDAPNYFFTSSDFENIANSDRPVYLFNGCADNSNSYVNKYIILGEQTDIHKRHLTANRKPWYSIEKRLPAPIWVSVFNRNGLRFVRNEANIYNLTTFHCVYTNNLIDTDVLFAYLITDVAKSIFLDNSRQYGNGLIKFEPNDLNKGMVANLSILSIEEVNFIKKIYHHIRNAQFESIGISLLNKFFEERFTTGITDFRDMSITLDMLQHISSDN